ncbi:site-specific integrase [Leuconostoc gasicomitatum]|uniref:site-specific integrase n=2 Tax=Lactobacillaceae TaxID=33958 RepID=UPI0007449043|nr:site-specific integrase [Leuconostoc gasicomitatum]CUR63420.1 Prophage Lp2 protein 2, integrase [Leuconostoc gasicomitatum KG16-1]
MASFEKRGKKWRAIVSAIEGINRVKRSKTFKTKKEATEWAIKVENSKVDGYTISRATITLPEYFLEWYERYRKPNIRESTQMRYISEYNRVKILFEGVKLEQLNTPLVQDKLDEYGKTVAPATLSKFWDIVKSCLRDAQIDGLIKKDIWTRVKTHSTKSGADKGVLSATDFSKLQSYLYDHIDTNSDLGILIALETGARLGEIAAITLDDIDFEKNTINISKSYSIAVQKLTETKNMQSHRIIAITEQFSKLLHDNSDYLPLYSHYYNRQFSRRLKDIIDALDIPHLRFHDLRHSHASFLLYNDVSIDYVSKRLGHKNTRITLDVYAHMLKEKETEQSTMALKFLSSSPQMSPESKNNA